MMIPERYFAMLDEARCRSDEDWFAASSLPSDDMSFERSKFSDVAAEKVNRFRDYYIGGIGIEISDYEAARPTLGQLKQFDRAPNKGMLLNPDFIKHIGQRANESIEALHPTDRQLWMIGFDDSIDLGGVKTLCVVDERIFVCSRFSLRMANRLVRLSKALNEIDHTPRSAVELGGGFGKTLGDMVEAWALPTAYYIDLPLNMLLSVRYFGVRFPGRVNTVWNDGDKVRNGCINIVAPWLIHKIPSDIDFMCNFLSMQHMVERSQLYYWNALVKDRVRVLYHENRLQPRDSVEHPLLDSPIRMNGSIVHREPVFVTEFRATVDGSANEANNLTVFGETIRYR